MTYHELSATEEIATEQPPEKPLEQQYRELLQDYSALKEELEAVREENRQLKDNLKKSQFGFDAISPRAFCFFTGLRSVGLFLWLLAILKRSTSITLRGGLTWENNFLIVLMKIRLGLLNRDIAYRFGTSFTTVSRILREWIPLLSSTLRPMIVWPSKEKIRAKLPRVFKPKYKNCRCIIDCTEIFIQRTFNMTARSETWSNYKHQNTMKYLIGITPTGSISFLSDGWGGRASDKLITIDSGFLKKVDPKDEILADRGFLIREELAMVGATLRIPSFTKSKSQLSGRCVDTSRQLSRVRIHVERVIGQLKQFLILNTVIPISQVDLLDDVIVICAALTNKKRSVVPLKR
ncbi:uncharacterized protein LOC134466577 [Engraulis encrasicolus]|uniref:uncharacterized protein LOC134466577 n=1 Tax=Engraulis encrasicolus TaxID=184585 RepID=UPI002FD17733